MAVTPDSLDLPWEQRLQLYKTNKKAAQLEILRTKKVYYEEKDNGASADRLAQISNWAALVRQAAGIPDSDAIYGNFSGISEVLDRANVELLVKDWSYTPSGDLNGNYGLQTPSDTLSMSDWLKAQTNNKNNSQGISALGDKGEMIQIGAFALFSIAVLSLFKR